jgi:hypothetical protein
MSGRSWFDLPDSVRALVAQFREARGRHCGLPARPVTRVGNVKMRGSSSSSSLNFTNAIAQSFPAARSSGEAHIARWTPLRHMPERLDQTLMGDTRKRR